MIVAHSGSHFQWPQPSRRPRPSPIFETTTQRSKISTSPQKPNRGLSIIGRRRPLRAMALRPCNSQTKAHQCPCISKRYMAGQGTGAVVRSKTRELCWRWLTLNEIRKLHRIPDSYQLSDASKTLSGEVIGQGVIVSLFEKLSKPPKILASSKKTFRIRYLNKRSHTPLYSLLIHNSASLFS